jgi:hypothetical protein
MCFQIIAIHEMTNIVVAHTLSIQDGSVAPRVHEQLLVMQHKFIHKGVSTYHLTKYICLTSILSSLGTPKYTS